MHEHFGSLEGVEADIDDITVHADTEIKHATRLHAVLDRSEKINLTLHKESVSSKSRKLPELVTNSHKKESSPMTRKICAINNMSAPTDRKGVQRHL